MNMEKKKDLPLITIVTVVYNGIDDIEQTILSVLNQSYSNIEYIIIDGKSEDGTVDIIKKYENKLAYWISEPDNGIYYAMNKGISMATGEWIHFRNCGDFFLDKDVLINIFKKPISDNVMIVHGDSRFMDHSGYRDLKPAILRESIKKKMPIFHPSAFIRTSLHKEFLYNVQYRSSADYECIYRIIKKGYQLEYRPIIVSTYNAITGFSLDHWKLEKKEIWNWRYSNFPLKFICMWIDILQYSLRKKIYRLRTFLVNR